MVFLYFTEIGNGEIKCGAGFFSCGTGKCIPLEKKCNTFDDCGDSSDEQNCGKTS